MNDPNRERLSVISAFITLAIAAYAWSLSGQFLNWDDPTYIQNNPELRQGYAGVGTIFSTFHFSNYNPLQRLSYLIEWQSFGNSATAFRVTNLVLHLGNALLLFALLRIWTRQFVVAAGAAALFLVHPANVESVAWVSERKTLMATGFALGSVLCWLRAREGMRAGRPIAWLLFTLGMLCKTSIVGLPVLLIVMDLASRRPWREQAAWYAAFFVPAIALGLTQLSATADAVRPLHGGSLVTHVATIVAVVPFYFLNLVFPFGMTPRHEFATSSLGDPRFWLGLVTLAAIGWGVVRSWRGERRFATAIAWCFAALMVTLIVPIPTILADRYCYFAMPLLLAVFVESLGRLPIPNPRHVHAALGAIVLLFCVTTANYAYAWRDSTTLWTHALTQRPDDPEAWVSLGAARSEVGDMGSAAKAYHQALKLSPDYSEATENLANIEIQAGRLPAAQQRLAALLKREPKRSTARAMLAATFDLQGDVVRAEQEFTKSLETDPNNTAVLMNYVNFCERHRRQQDAHRAVSAFLERHPRNAPAREALFRLSRVAGPGRE